jgi:hypothetical protein
MPIKPWNKTVTPREDLLEGKPLPSFQRSRFGGMVARRESLRF